MNIPNNFFTRMFRRNNRRAGAQDGAPTGNPRPPGQAGAQNRAAANPATAGTAQVNAQVIQEPPRSQPIPIGGTRPGNLPLPIPAYLRERPVSRLSGHSSESGAHGTPPPGYTSRPDSMHASPANRSDSPNAFLTTGVQTESPAPSFQVLPRQNETRLLVGDEYDHLGRSPSLPGSLRTNPGSMAAHYPRSELRPDTPDTFASRNSSLNAAHGHEEGSAGSSPIFTSFFEEMRRRDADPQP